MLPVTTLELLKQAEGNKDKHGSGQTYASYTILFPSNASSVVHSERERHCHW